jgi:hypothetical protein
MKPFVKLRFFVAVVEKNATNVFCSYQQYITFGFGGD